MQARKPKKNYRKHLEGKLKSNFKEFCKNTFPGCYVYSVFSCGYSGGGHPDLLIIIDGVNLHVEAKDELTIEKAIDAREASQVACHKKLVKAKANVILLYATGCALYDENYNWTEFKDISEQFSSFKALLSWIKSQ